MCIVRIACVYVCVCVHLEKAQERGRRRHGISLLPSPLPMLHPGFAQAQRGRLSAAVSGPTRAAGAERNTARKRQNETKKGKNERVFLELLPFAVVRCSAHRGGRRGTAGAWLRCLASGGREGQRRDRGKVQGVREGERERAA